METFSCHQGLGRSLLAVGLKERRSEIVDYQSANFNTDIRNCRNCRIFSVTSDAAGTRGKGHVKIRMPPQILLVGWRGWKMASVTTETLTLTLFSDIGCEAMPWRCNNNWSTCTSHFSDMVTVRSGMTVNDTLLLQRSAAQMCWKAGKIMDLVSVG